MIRRALLAAATALAACGVGSVAFIGSPQAASAAEPLNPVVQPDAVLNAGQTVVFKHTTPLIGSAYFYSPRQCRGDDPPDPSEPDASTAPIVCKSYRIALNIDTNPKADNHVLFKAEFDQIKPNALVAVAAGINPAPLNGLDVYVWDAEDHYLGQNAPGTLDPVFGPGDPEDVPPGSATFNSPEIGGFKVKQKVYDITVNASRGLNQTFDLRVTYSNEIFKQPSELLDQLGLPPDAAQNDDSSSPPSFFSDRTPSDATTEVTLPQADLLPDADLAGVGLGVSEQFDPQQAGIALGRSTRSISTTASKPSALALVLGLVLLPIAATAAVVVMARRRRQALLG